MKRLRKQSDENALRQPGHIRVVVLLIAGLLAGMIALQNIAPIHAGPLLSVQTDQDEPTSSKLPTNSFSEPVGDPPAWVIKGSYIDETTGTEYVVVKSDELLKQREAEEELEERLVDTVRDKVDDLFGRDAGKAIGIDLQYIRNNLLQSCEECDGNGIYFQLRRWPVSEENLDKVDSPVRDAFQCYAQVRFDDKFESWAATHWKNRLVVSRTMQTALIALSTLSVLALMFGYFTAEHKTRGFYSRRLQTASVGLLMMFGLVFWLLATRFAWL